jgi:hypothetical protein
MWQQAIIALLVVFAAGYVVWTFLPMMRRQRLLDALAAHGVLTGAAARHRARLATPGCGNCAAADPQVGEQTRRRHRPT